MIDTVGDRDRDAALVTRAATGDADAFDALISPRLERLFRMARAIVQDASLARDVVQEACVLAWRELPAIREPRRFDGWLTQIVVNAAKTQLRSRRRRSVREIELETSDREGLTGPSPGPLIGDQVLETEAVRRAFQRLDADARTLLVLHYVEDRPIAEIAAALRTPSGTVKWRLSRARQALERALEAER